MKCTLFAILLLFALLSCNKKKKEEEPYVPVKQTYTDIPGSDIYIANTDSVFVDTGLVITVKGKGFDPKYKGHYTLMDFDFDVFYSYDNLPKEPEMIYFDETTIKFKYPVDYFETNYGYQACRDKVYNFSLVKYSDDPMAERNYEKRFLSASSPKNMYLKGHCTIFKDTVALTKPRIALPDFFMYYYVNVACSKLSLVFDNQKIVNLEGTRDAYTQFLGKPYYYIGIPLDSSYGISDGYHTVKLINNGEEVYCVGEKKGVFVKNVR